MNLFNNPSPMPPPDPSNSMSAAPTYIVFRDIPLGAPYDPTAPPVFFPPKDSDELFDALRAKYPHLKTHSERMRDAVIEFLLEERQLDAADTTLSPTVPDLLHQDTASPWQQSWPSVSSTTLSSPDIAALHTPIFTNSPATHDARLDRARHSSTSTSGDAAAPDIAQMTSVFSLSSAEQPKQRVRRRMTEAEKIEYRKRRIVKACDKCAKRKRKCTHNQMDVEGTKSNSHVGKVGKFSGHTRTVTPSQHLEAAVQQPVGFDGLCAPNALTSNMGEYDDFTLMFDDKPFDIDIDDMLQFNPLPDLEFAGFERPMLDWPSCNTPDPTLLDTIISDSSRRLTPSVPGVPCSRGSQSKSVSQVKNDHETIEKLSFSLDSASGIARSHSPIPSDRRNTLPVDQTRHRGPSEGPSSRLPDANEWSTLEIQHRGQQHGLPVASHSLRSQASLPRDAEVVQSSSQDGIRVNNAERSAKTPAPTTESPRGSASLSTSSLGKSIDRMASPSTELFMLRRRITPLNNNGAMALSNAAGTQRKTSTSNGGAYPRSESQALAHSAFTHGSGSLPDLKFTGRKMDHFWVRDHHGRFSRNSDMALAVSCALLLLGLFTLATADARSLLPALLLASIGILQSQASSNALTRCLRKIQTSASHGRALQHSLRNICT